MATDKKPNPNLAAQLTALADYQDMPLWKRVVMWSVLGLIVLGLFYWLI